MFFSLFAETSTGCIFGGSALGKRNLNTQEVSAQAVSELLGAIKCGGCVDSHIQDQVCLCFVFVTLCTPVDSFEQGDSTFVSDDNFYGFS